MKLVPEDIALYITSFQFSRESTTNEVVIALLKVSKFFLGTPSSKLKFPPYICIPNNAYINTNKKIRIVKYKKLERED